MPGVDLNLDLPSLSDNFATIVSKMAVALAAIEDDLAALVVPSEININTSLSMAGNALIDTGSLLLVSGNAPTAAGSIYYEDGEFWAIDSTGAIQLTDAGNLNAASLGSIVGDYGGLNPARVTYDNASGEFRFTEETGVYADLVCDDVVLVGTNGSVRLSAGDGITTARQVQIEELPTSGVAGLVYQASDSSLRSGLTVRETGTHLFTNIDVSTSVKHGTRYVTVAPLNGTGFSIGWAGSNSLIATVAAAPSTGYFDITVPLIAGDRLSRVTVWGSTDGAPGNDPTITIHTYTPGSGTGTTPAYSVTADRLSTTGFFQITLNTPFTLSQTTTIGIKIIGAGSGATTTINCFALEFDHP